MSLKLRVKHHSNISQIRSHLEKLQDLNIAKINVKVYGKFAALNLVDCGVDTLTVNIREVSLSTAQEEVLGYQGKKKNTLGHK